MSSPLVSIIIPVFNGEKYIEKLIRQISKNSYNNIEILIGNDASTDQTDKIVQNFKDDKNITIFTSLKNIGPGAIRNKLMKLSKGEYLVMQDADDLFDESRFQKQVEFLNNNLSIDVVGSHAQLIDVDKVWGRISTPEFPKLSHWFRQNSMVHASVMFRKEVLTKGASYSESMRFGEDYYFLTELYFQGARFYNIQEELYHYYIAPVELKTRVKRYYFLLVKSKVDISALFPLYQKPFFILFHVMKMSLSYLLSIVKNQDQSEK